MIAKDEVEEVYRRLAEAMPGRGKGAKGPKGQPDAFRSCIACMLSAQSLDRNTEAATKALFRLAETPGEMLALEDDAIRDAIRPCGLYNMKTKNIRRFCETLIEEHDGIIPDTREGLLALPGIGRKCADIVLSFTFGKDVIAVDTDVHRVCNRIGLTRAKTAEKTAHQLEERSPRWALGEGHFWLIQFGKKVCRARTPRCDACVVCDICETGPIGRAADA
ncbi:endonuclease III [Erythrobacter sp. HL-111]|uniref:endonuclease III domain-containing protein n=1 Tax=Erythrobacter sp. HL-111 TaxID=1798193 RepID=UPI0006D9574C|nr:endonuclease III [Erythrobacter sp. HL-111]KPP94788.1 MAG: endonuclease III [Erythrobacteraceae bacterium HL-111]SDS85229.1 endonuclease-3 [Erythrobacter sp. HL-111]